MVLPVRVLYYITINNGTVSLCWVIIGLRLAKIIIRWLFWFYKRVWIMVTCIQHVLFFLHASMIITAIQASDNSLFSLQLLSFFFLHPISDGTNTEYPQRTTLCKARVIKCLVLIKVTIKLIKSVCFWILMVEIIKPFFIIILYVTEHLYILTYSIWHIHN